MSSLANDLLNDFEESGSENGESFHGEENETDEQHHNDLDQQMSDGDAASDEDYERQDSDREEEDATKAKVERMKLGAISDVRSVAGLMKTLQPVLEVSFTLPTSYLR